MSLSEAPHPARSQCVRMTMPNTLRYTLQAGRVICRDGHPILYLNIVTNPITGKYAISPSDADDYAVIVTHLLNQWNGA